MDELPELHDSADMLSLSAHLPALAFEPGQAVVHQGETLGAIWVLVAGELQVARDGVTISTIAQPGALVGEISVLLGGPYGATVTASAPSLLRHAADGEALLRRHPAVVRLLAEGLARRLNALTSYLVDLKQQYGDAPGLSMVAEVLRELSQQPVAAVRTGSARDPDPEY